MDIMFGGNAEKRREVELLVACDMKKHLTQYTRIPTPVRPEDIEATDDDTIIAAMKKAGQGKKLTKDDLHVVRLFAMWRNAVWLVESRNVGRFESIVWAARVFESWAVDYPAHSNDLAELASFIDAEWSFAVLPKVPEVWDMRRRASEVVRDYVQLPVALRHAGGVAPERRSDDQVPKSLGALAGGGGWMSEFEGAADADE